jgi:hypothetical protein
MHRNETEVLFNHFDGGDEQLVGTARPSALAVLRLITSRKVVGCRTGSGLHHHHAWT